MTTSISNIISDESSDCAASSVLPGLSIPSSYNSYLTVKPFDQCKACSKCFNPHKCWQDISIDPSHMRDYLQDQITKSNNIREKLRALQALTGLMERVCTGVPTITEWSNNPISNRYGGWPVVGVNSEGVTVRYISGSDNPNSISWVVTTDNPDWQGENDTQHTKYLNTSYSSAIDMKGILTFSPNSFMGQHSGFIVQRIPQTLNIQLNDTFTIYTDTPCSSMATQYAPNADTGQPILAYVRNYVGPFRENYISVRPYLYTWYGLKTLTIPVPTHQVYTIWSAGRIILPQYGPDYFTCQATTDNINWSDVSFSASQLYTEPYNGSYRTRLDLTNFNVTGIAYLKLQFWGEDSSGNYPFYSTCKNSCIDHTGSYGRWSPDSRRHFCSKAADVVNHTGGQAIIDAFTYDCNNSKCPYWTPDQIPSITDVGLWSQLLYSHPFKIVVTQPNNQISRIGVASLGSLAGLDLTTYNILDTEQHYDWFKGTLPKQCRWADADGNNQVHRIGGFETKACQSAGTYPDFSNNTTFPPSGPGGNNIAGRVQDYGYNAVNISNDPYKILSNQVTLASADLDRYTLAFKSSIGQFQRFRSGFQLWFPKIQSGNGIQTYNDGTYQKFYADKDFNVQQAKDANTVYFGCIKAKSLRYAREFNDLSFGNTISASIWSSSKSGSNVTINLNNGNTNLNIYVQPQVTRTATIRCAGNLAGIPDWARIRNYASNQNSVGPGRQYIQVGMVAEISGIKGKYYVTAVHPAAGDKIPFDPNATDYDTATDSVWYDNAVNGSLGLPANNKFWGCQADQVVLLDENGMLAKATLAKGQTITFSWTGVMMPGTSTVYQSDPVGTGNDASVSCDVFSGLGEYWIKTDTDFFSKCIYITTTIADRSCIPSYTEFNSMLRAFEKEIYD